MRSRASRFFAAAVFFVGVVSADAATQITNNDSEAFWGTRHGVLSRGKILYGDNGTVMLYSGGSSTPIQAEGDLGGLADFLFALGSGAGASDVIGSWRRGTDHLWVSVNGATPFEVAATNPINEGVVMNPESVSIADGCVFAGFQAFSVLRPGFGVQHVYKVDLATGVATSISGTADVPGRAGQVATSGCRAAWIFDDLTVEGDDTVYKLQYYNGTTTTTIDSGTRLGIQGRGAMADGRIVYTKAVNGVLQAFVYDTNAVSPAPVQISSRTLADRELHGVMTDGRHVGWVESAAFPLPSIPCHINVGGIQLTDDTNKPADSSCSENFPFHINRGQIAWRDAGGGIRFGDSAVTIANISTSPSTTVERMFLADGSIVWRGLTSGSVDTEVFLHSGSTPAPPALPAPWLATATAGPGLVRVTFEKILGATAYNIYMAEVPGVTPATYLGLRGGRKITATTSPHTITGLRGGTTYYFVVTAVEGTAESTLYSPQAQATLVNGQWSQIPGTAGVNFYDVATDITNRNIVYAAADDGKSVWKSSDSGLTWTSLSGVVDGKSVRGVAAAGATVLAATSNDELLRSTNSGTSWSLIFDSEDIGEIQKRIVFDASNPNIVYAADFAKTAGTGNFIVKSTNGGLDWTQLTHGGGGDIRAYGLAVEPFAPSFVWASGTGVPVALSSNGGTTFSDVSPAGGFFRALAIPPSQSGVVYTAGTNFSAEPIGVYRGVRGSGTSVTWTQKNNGLGLSLPDVYSLFVHPTNPSNVHASTENGYYLTNNSADDWFQGPQPGGSINRFAMGGFNRLIAATSNGLYIRSVADLRGDFNADAKQDVVLRNYTTGQNALWILNGTALQSIVDLPALPNTNYRIEGTADLNADGKPDIVLRNYSTGQNALWIMNNTNLGAIVDLPALPNTNYHIEGTADFSGDGGPDLILRNYATGQNAVWIMSGTSVSSIVDLPTLANTNYRIESAADFSGDGRPDIILRNYATGQNALWIMNGTALQAIVDLPTLANTNYRIDGVGNFNADAYPDIILRNYSTGQNAVWLMQGTSLSSIVDLPALANPAYEINGPR